MKKRVLFLCIGNSCRSQMAEGWARHVYGDTIDVYAAGTAPHRVDPKAIQIMAEVGMDISGYTSNHLEEYLEIPFDLVISVCDSHRRGSSWTLSQSEGPDQGFCRKSPSASQLKHLRF